MITAGAATTHIFLPTPHESIELRSTRPIIRLLKRWHQSVVSEVQEHTTAPTDPLIALVQSWAEEDAADPTAQAEAEQLQAALDETRAALGMRSLFDGTNRPA